MKMSTLMLVFEVAEKQGYDLADKAEVAVEASEMAEYAAAVSMGTSGQPDWSAPWIVTEERMERAVNAAVRKSDLRPTRRVA